MKSKKSFIIRLQITIQNLLSTLFFFVLDFLVLDFLFFILKAQQPSS